MATALKPYTPGWYYRLGAFFLNKLGKSVYKIPIDAGFSCPNRDGTVGETGCSYCYNPSFSPCSGSAGILSPGEQLRRGKKKKKGASYLAYFQAYTNTYAPLDKLRELYDEALLDPEVIGLSIATRPDCVSEEIVDLLAGYTRDKHVWIEYGLQSAHDRTLESIKRGHSLDAFTRAIELTRKRGIYICAHIILGLPGETPAMMHETISYINNLGLDGIKFHHLQVIRHTTLEREYYRGEVAVYEKWPAYISLLCDCLERLNPNIVVHRLAGQSTSPALLIAPHWAISSGQIATNTVAELKKRGSYQGLKYIYHPATPH